MRPLRDPAPSRLAYKLNRLMLKPGFRRFLRTGLPVLLVAGSVAFWASDQARRDDATDRVADLRRQIEQRPEFMVHMMEVENASPDVAAEIRARLPLDFPITSFDLELDDIRVEVETLDAVASATVHIRPGGVLSVDVRERVPVLIWRLGDTLELLDAEGHRVAAITTRAERVDLPLIVGKGARGYVAEALALIGAADALAGRTRGFLRVGQRRWDIVLDRDQRIMLPEADPLDALEKVIALNEAQDLLARDIAAIDFRNSRRPVLRLTNSAIETMLDSQLTEIKD